MRPSICDRGRPRPLAAYPGADTGIRLDTPLFGLAPSGVFIAVDVTVDAVRSYRTGSPLPD